MPLYYFVHPAGKGLAFASQLDVLRHTPWGEPGAARLMGACGVERARAFADEEQVGVPRALGDHVDRGLRQPGVDRRPRRADRG